LYIQAIGSINILFMLKIIQLVSGLFILIIIIPQTPTENIVLRKFNETGFFANYKDAKKFVDGLTWSLITIFIVLTFVLNFI
jgi:preprotein translocase subunit SecG